MTTPAFARICNVPGCGEPATGNSKVFGMCAAHKSLARKKAAKRNGRIRGKKWAVIRKEVLRRDPVCRDGRVCHHASTSTQVDHVIPLMDGGHPTSLDNLQGICEDCHVEKTNEEFHRQIGWKDQ